MFGRYGFGYPNTGQGGDLLAFQNRVIADGGEMVLDAGEIAALMPLGDWSWFYVPGGRKAGVSYAQIPGSAGDLTMTRASVANENARNGTLTEVAANVGRLDFLSGVFQGQPAEPAATNLVFPSATATTQSRTVTAVAHTLSFFGTGSVTLSGAATGTLNGTGANNRVTLTFTPTAGSLTLTVAGSVTNWQLEAGTVATSPITTVGTIVTRQADVFTRAAASGLIGQQSGTFYFEGEANNIDDDIIYINRSVTNSVVLYKDGTNRLIGRIYHPSGSIIFQTAINFTGRFKAAIAYQSGNSAFFVNGSQVGATNTNSFTFNTALDLIEVRKSVAFFAGVKTSLLRAAGISQRRWTNAELANLTRL